MAQNKSAEVGMKWVKASERLPDVEGEYFIVDVDGIKRVMYASGHGHQTRWKATVDIWLDESAEGQQLTEVNKITALIEERLNHMREYQNNCPVNTYKFHEVTGAIAAFENLLCEI
jgi:hypothetical protein